MSSILLNASGRSTALLAIFATVSLPSSPPLAGLSASLLVLK